MADEDERVREIANALVKQGLYEGKYYETFAEFRKELANAREPTSIHSERQLADTLDFNASTGIVHELIAAIDDEHDEHDDNL